MKFRKWNIVLGLLILLALVLRLILSFHYYDYFVDDTYIFMRYGENIGAGYGPVYNPGERVMGFTSISYVAIIGFFNAIFPNFMLDFFIKFLNQVLFFISAIMLLVLIDCSRPLRFSMLMVFLFCFPFVDVSLSGMESSLFCVFILATFIGIKNRAFVGACLFAAAAFATRPEGIFLLIPCLVLSYLQMPKRQFLLTFLVLAVIGGVTATGLSLYYGSCIPHSIIAKSSLSNVSRWAGTETNPLQKAVLLALAVSDTYYFTLPFSIRCAFTVLTVSCIFLAAINMRHFAENRPELLIAALFYLLVLCFYIVGNPVRIFSWYTIPTSLCFLLVSFASIERFLGRMHLNHLQLWISTVVVIVSVLSPFVALPYRLKTIERHVGDLHKLAVTLRHNYSESKSIMIADIGVVGYTTGLRVIDLAGLVTPEVLDKTRKKPVVLGSLIDRMSPDIICLQKNLLERDMVVESSIRYQSFDSEQQRNRFLRNYSCINLGSHFYPYVFIRK
jgi:hypothetical protein